MTLVDSSAWINALRETANRELREELARLVRRGQAATCGAVMAEVIGGVRTAGEYRELQAELRSLPYYTWLESWWEELAEHLFKLTRRGETARLPDLIIATIARRHRLRLLHCDRDFARLARHFPDLRQVYFSAPTT